MPVSVFSQIRFFRIFLKMSGTAVEDFKISPARVPAIPKKDLIGGGGF